MRKLLLLLMMVPMLGFTPNSIISINNSHNNLNHVWALVMSEGTGYYNQMVRSRSYFPEDEIKAGFDDGKSITSFN